LWWLLFVLVIRWKIRYSLPALCDDCVIRSIVVLHLLIVMPIVAGSIVMWYCTVVLMLMFIWKWWVVVVVVIVVLVVVIVVDIIVIIDCYCCWLLSVVDMDYWVLLFCCYCCWRYWRLFGDMYAIMVWISVVIHCVGLPERVIGVGAVVIVIICFVVCSDALLIDGVRCSWCIVILFVIDAFAYDCVIRSTFIYVDCLVIDDYCALYGYWWLLIDALPYCHT